VVNALELVEKFPTYVYLSSIDQTLKW